MMRIFITTLLSLLLIVTLLPAAAQETIPRWEPLDRCPFDPPGGTDPRCGYLVVPEDRLDPATTQAIRIAVAVFPARSDTPAPDPVIYLDGGPGGATLANSPFLWGSLYGPLNRDRDVILFDQRGVGLSEPALTCPEMTDFSYDLLDVVLPVEEYVGRYRDAVIACGDRLRAEGINLAAYTSAASAADVEDLRRALGYEQLNLLGISYGTRLALTLLRDHPAGVRSAIIDSVVPLQGSGFDAAQTAARAFEELFTACETSPVCAARYPDLRAVFDQLVTDLNTEPARITVASPRGMQAALLDGDTFIGLLFIGLYADVLIPEIPTAIYAAQEGDYGFLETLYLLQLFQLDEIAWGMYMSVNCSEEYPFDTPASIESRLAQAPESIQRFARRALIDPAQLAICTAWGTRPPAPEENAPVVSDVPTLVLAGQFDPITPPTNAQAAAQSLSRSFYLEFPGLAHGVTPNGACTLSIVRAFLADPLTLPDTACIASIPQPFG
jgi:pimeloyl-ACP methyl ester carboxylesterase